MNFLRKLNPFHLNKELQRTILELVIAQNNYERVLSDNEILQQTYDDNPELIKCGGVEQYINGRDVGSDYKPQYTKRELKMLLDIHMLRQDNDELRENVVWSNVHKTDELKGRIEELKQEVQAMRAIDGSLRSDIQKLTEANELLSDLCKERTVELKQAKADLEKAKAQLAHCKKVNDTWFSTVLGYSAYDNILFNKAFWGKNIEVVDLPAVDNDEQDS